MNPKEMAALLGIMSARDGRDIGDADHMVWHEDLGRYDFETAKEAVRLHYAVSRERARPYDVLWHIKKIRGERIDAYGPIIPPDELADSPIQARLWVLSRREAIATGRIPPEREVQELPAGNARMRELVAQVAKTTVIPAGDDVEEPPVSPTISPQAARAIEEERRRQLEALEARSGGSTS